MLRELLHLVGVGINWILEPVSNSNRTGNHMGLQPHTFKDNVEYVNLYLIISYELFFISIKINL